MSFGKALQYNSSSPRGAKSTRSVVDEGRAVCHRGLYRAVIEEGSEGYSWMVGLCGVMILNEACLKQFLTKNG